MSTSRSSEPVLDAAPAVRVLVHPGLCAGSGECHRWAPHLFPLDETGHIDVQRMDVESEDADDAWWGASACPARAITFIGPPAQFWYDRLRLRLRRRRDAAAQCDIDKTKEHP